MKFTEIARRSFLSQSPSWQHVPGRVVFMVALTVAGLFCAGCSDGSRPSSTTTDPDGANPTEPQPGVGVSSGARAEVARDRPVSDRDLDPGADGWQSEVLADQVSAKLSQLADQILDPTADEQAWDALCAAGIDFGSLLPPSAAQVYQDGAIEVSRLAADPPGQPRAATTAGGREGFVREIHRLRDGLAGGDPSGRRIEFKVIAIEPAANSLRSTVRFAAYAPTPRVSVQLNATWDIDWSVLEGGGVGAMEGITVRDFEAVREAGGAAGGRLFADDTDAILQNEPRLRSELSMGISDWQGLVEKRFNIFRFGHHGLAVGDVDNDGRDDIYLPQPGGMTNRLLVQLDDGTVAERSAGSGVDLLDMTRSALILDLDNDGNQDLVVNTAAKVLFFAGNGSGRFKLKSVSDDGRAGYSMAAADYDCDGDLDLFVCAYASTVQEQGQFPFPVPYHDANNGGANVLLRNEGGLRFVDATAAAGLDVDNRRFSFAAAWEDYDNDGDLDLYVANDYGRNNLYRNDSAGSAKAGAVQFSDVAASAGAEDVASGMSVSWGDYNRDGSPDIYVGNMFSAAGNRIAYKRQFQADAAEGTRASLQRLAAGNSLFAGSGGGRFEDVSRPARVSMGRWAWSSIFADINNDGWEDLLVANGYMTGARKDDL